MLAARRTVGGWRLSLSTDTNTAHPLFTDHASQLHYCTAPAVVAVAVHKRTVGGCGDFNQTHPTRSRSPYVVVSHIYGSLSIICIEMQLLPEWLGWLELEPKTAARFL